MSWSVLCLLVVISNCANSLQKIVEGPTNTNVMFGGTALLKCRVEAQVFFFLSTPEVNKFPINCSFLLEQQH
ncbi:unnamed protein product [Gongylonema pulchrum]|uniref:IGv domain-containing protein n=1 Tax=Gongylonema pulchrum TaxID=637853 RepID=A0A183DI80_9BILA|nr:unnamed protein product [Gongylonema pulchrum]